MNCLAAQSIATFALTDFYITNIFALSRLQSHMCDLLVVTDKGYRIFISLVSGRINGKLRHCFDVSRFSFDYDLNLKNDFVVRFVKAPLLEPHRAGRFSRDFKQAGLGQPERQANASTAVYSKLIQTSFFCVYETNEKMDLTYCDNQLAFLFKPLSRPSCRPRTNAYGFALETVCPASRPDKCFVQIFLLPSENGLQQTRFAPSESVRAIAWNANGNFQKFAVDNEMVQQIYFPAKTYLMFFDDQYAFASATRPVEQLFAKLKAIVIFKCSREVFSAERRVPPSLQEYITQLGVYEFCAQLLQILLDCQTDEYYAVSVSSIISTALDLRAEQTKESIQRVESDVLAYVQKAQADTARNPCFSCYKERISAADNQELIDLVHFTLQNLAFHKLVQSQASSSFAGYDELTVTSSRSVLETSLNLFLSRLLVPIWSQNLFDSANASVEINYSATELRTLLQKLDSFAGVLVSLKIVR